MIVLHAGVASIIGAEFAAAAVLISFGAVLGKVSPIQLLMMAFVEVVLFEVNQLIVFNKLQVQLTLCMLPVNGQWRRNEINIETRPEEPKLEVRRAEPRVGFLAGEGAVSPLPTS